MNPLISQLLELLKSLEPAPGADAQSLRDLVVERDGAGAIEIEEKVLHKSVR